MLWLRALSFVLLVQATVVGVVPWLLSKLGPRLPLGAWRMTGWLPVLLGIALLAWCNVLFVRQGRGTAAPYDPPRALVLRGPYRYVRNPMYLSAALIILGLGMWTEAVSVFAYLALAMLGYSSFVRYYEEPRLTAQFGAAYQSYPGAVPRWLPRLPRS